MSKTNIRKNASGYYDPTAYLAMSNYIREEKEQKKKMAMAKPNKGEIWEIQQTNGAYKTVIVLAAYDDVSVILQVSEKGSSNSIEVNCQGIRYTDPRKIHYSFNDQFINFARELNQKEYDDIMDAVADALGLDSGTSYDDSENVPEVITGDLTLLNVPECRESCNDSLDIEAVKELERTKAERDIYKGLYEKLLKQMMK